MSIHTTDIRTALTQCAKAAVLKHEVNAEDLPFDLNCPGDSEQFHNYVELIEQALTDQMHNMVITAIHHGGL